MEKLMNRITGETRYSLTTGEFPMFAHLQKNIHLVELTVELEKKQPYHCWGFEIQLEENAKPGPLTFDHTWTTVGQALDEALERLELDR
jgi:hypothetical protein